MEARVRGYFRRAWADEATKATFAEDPAAFVANDDRFAAMAKAAEQFGLTLSPEDTAADIGRAANTNPLEERPSLLRLVQEAEAGAYDVLIVHRVVDISRVCSQVVEILARLQAVGIRVLAAEGEPRWLDGLDDMEKVRTVFIEESAAQMRKIGRERLRHYQSEDAKRRAKARG